MLGVMETLGVKLSLGVSEELCVPVRLPDCVVDADCVMLDVDELEGESVVLGEVVLLPVAVALRVIEMDCDAVWL